VRNQERARFASRRRMQLMHGLSAKLRRSLNLNNPNGDTEMRPAQSGIEILVLTNVRSTSRSQSWLNTSPALVIGSNTFFYARTRTNLHAGIAGSDNRNYRRLSICPLSGTADRGRLLPVCSNKIRHFLQSIFPASRAGKTMGRPGERHKTILWAVPIGPGFERRPCA
jgi:hypothetical protein